jgi:penicillin-binding protein-related factor A (putative recombinase)
MDTMVSSVNLTLKKPETIFKERVLPKLRKLPNSWFEKIQQVSLSGTPDIIGCLNGRFIAIELKKDAISRIEPLQVHKLNKIEKSGGIALVVYPENWEESYEFLKSLD